MSTNELLGFSKIYHVKLIISQGTYKKLCSLLNFLLSIHKKLGSLILKSSFLVAGFYCICIVNVILLISIVIKCGPIMGSQILKLFTLSRASYYELSCI